jgi:hypothetical protein
MEIVNCCSFNYLELKWYMPPNKSSDRVKTYGGVGCEIGGSFNSALPPNKSLQANWQARFLINRIEPVKALSSGVASLPLPIA